MEEKITFGTSGFRGIYGERFTKANVEKIAYAITCVLKEEKKSKPIAIGFDNRFMGKEFAIWISEVICASGFKVIFFDKPTPSPVIAYQTVNADLGIHITASHNPYIYNGIKIFIEGGRESPSEWNDRIAKIANYTLANEIQHKDFQKAIIEGEIEISDNITDYCNHILSIVDSEVIKKKKVKVLVNPMNGSGTEAIKYILDTLKVNYQLINASVDPCFNGKIPAPYVNNLGDQIETMKKGNFNFGFAFDGDGDRITFIDKDGTPYDCNYLSAIIYNYFIEYKRIKGDIVKNCALTELVNRLADFNSCEAINAKVGFKNIAIELMKNPNAILGAETNGMAYKNHILHKDGIMSATIMLEIICSLGKTIKQMIEDLQAKVGFVSVVEEFSYPVSDVQKMQIRQKIFIKKEVPKTPKPILETEYADGFKMIFKNGYWVVIRFSGNENVVRIFAEQETKEDCDEYIALCERFIGVSERQV